MVKQAVRLAVLALYAQAARQAPTAKPERMGTAWAFRMSRFHVPF